MAGMGLCLMIFKLFKDKITTLTETLLDVRMLSF